MKTHLHIYAKERYNSNGLSCPPTDRVRVVSLNSLVWLQVDVDQQETEITIYLSKEKALELSSDLLAFVESEAEREKTS